jgi:5-formyltetrahydrofolate cyclo-ligase
VATAKLVAQPQWQDADTVVISPDDATVDARKEAIRAGKRLFVPLPKTDRAVLLENVDPKQSSRAALMKEIERFGQVVPLTDLKDAPLFVTSALSVDRYGNWLGQGDIFGELNPSLTGRDGVLNGAFRAVLVDDMQIFEDFGYLMAQNDAPMDLLVTKTKVVTPETRPEAPPTPSGTIQIR